MNIKTFLALCLFAFSPLALAAPSHDDGRCCTQHHERHDLAQSHQVPGKMCDKHHKKNVHHGVKQATKVSKETPAKHHKVKRLPVKLDPAKHDTVKHDKNHHAKHGALPNDHLAKVCATDHCAQHCSEDCAKHCEEHCQADGEVECAECCEDQCCEAGCEKCCDEATGKGGHPHAGH